MASEAYQRKFRAAEALHLQGDIGKAESLYRELLTEGPAVGVLGNLGVLLREGDRYEEALPFLLRAARAAPQNTRLLYNLANALADTGRSAEAEAAYRRVLQLDPQHALAQLNLGHLLLSIGRYTEAWPLYERRIGLSRQGNPTPPQRMPRWRGENLSGKSILVMLEQGLGDQIMFSRFCLDLKARGASRVSLACSPALSPLLAQLVDTIIPVHGPVEVPPHDYWTYAGSLPGQLGVTLETLSGAPYLRVPDPYRRAWAGAWPPGVNVGVVWRGNPHHERDRHRSMPERSLLSPLFACGANIIDMQDPQGDFADSAARFEQLDLLISVDTAPAHLAGALGRPCWILCPAIGLDWRWMRARADSAWYQTVRLYRQGAPGDWSGVIQQVAGDLSALVADISDRGAAGRRRPRV